MKFLRIFPFFCLAFLVSPWQLGASELTQPVRGVDEAPVTLVEFGDFYCPYCKKTVAIVEKLMQNYEGKIRWIFRHFPLSTDAERGSFLAHEASVCAQEQGHFWEFHDQIFDFPGIPQKSNLYDMARDLKLDMTAFEQCLSTHKHKQFIMDDREEGYVRGVRGTPTFFVNEHKLAGAYDYQVFEQTVESILHPEITSPPAEALPASAFPEVVAFDDLAGRPANGPPNAPVTLVEFSDFHCPFCRQLAGMLSPLMEKYKGKIYRVFRHFPLDMHEGAHRAHEASECAAEGGKFWEFHREFFVSPHIVRGDDQLMDLAEKVGLDKTSFKSCLDSGKHRETVQKDIEKGKAVGVRGTPTLFINGRLAPGLQPYERYEYLIEKELESS